ncbi:MAG: SIMPL domain-containing protein, partial [Ferruginibacter sp.]
MKQHLNTILFCLAIIIGLSIVANAYKYKFTSSETVSVTGMSEIDFTSDLIVWGGSFSRNAINLKDAYAALKQDEIAL